VGSEGLNRLLVWLKEPTGILHFLYGSNTPPALKKVFSSGEGLGLTLFAFCLVAPVAEEIFFRGFLYTALRPHLGARWAAVITAAFFATAHAVSIVPLFVMGLLFAYVRERTDRLWCPIVIHIVNNSLACLQVFLGLG